MTNRINPTVELAGPKSREVRRSAIYWMVLARPEFARQRLERERGVFKAGWKWTCGDHA